MNFDIATNYADRNKWSELHMSIAIRDTHKCAVLLERGHPFWIPDSKGRTPLHLAAGTNNATACKMLLAKGADPFAIDDDGKTPLERATRFPEVVDVLRPIVWRARLASIAGLKGSSSPSQRKEIGL